MTDKELLFEVSSRPLVSVIMNCYNGEQYLREAIDSVFAQTYQNWEIIFWDNASTDRSAEIALSYGQKIKYFRSEKNINLYDARNRAIGNCNGDYVAFLDVDDVWMPDAIKMKVDIFKNNEQVDFVYSSFAFADSDLNIYTQPLGKTHPVEFQRDILIRNPISIGSVLIRTKLLKQNNFDCSYNLLGDMELWFRISSIARPFYLQELLEISRQHGNNTSKIEKKNWIKEQRYFASSYIMMYLRTRKYKKISMIVYFIIRSEIRNFLLRSSCDSNREN